MDQSAALNLSNLAKGAVMELFSYELGRLKNALAGSGFGELPVIS